MAALQLRWNRIDARSWADFPAIGARSGLQQAWSYGEALRAGGSAVDRAAAYAGGPDPVAVAQIARRRILGLVGVAFLLRGPVWASPQERCRHEPAMLAAIRHRLRREIMVWSPEEPSPMRRRAVMTGYSTAWVDLAPGPAGLRARLDGKWRNALRQAERADLAIRSSRGGSLLTWLLDANERHRREVGYRGPTRAFLDRLAQEAAASDDLLVLVAEDGAAPVAGVMLVCHGRSATYEVGYVTARGRALRAGHLLLGQAAVRLAERGTRWLDLGGLNTDRAPGIARFKLGLGGQVATLPGTFLLLPTLGPWPAA